MTRLNICWIAVAGVGLLAGTPAAQADPDNVLLARIGEFQLDTGDTKIVQRVAIKAYRVCMAEGRDAVPLKVTYDGKHTIVEPGECQLIEAHKIKLASAERLHDGMTLIGRVGGSTSRSRMYQTDVSPAQAARND